MGNVKYSSYISSNGYIDFNTEHTYEREFTEKYEYLKLIPKGTFNIYLNNSTDFITISGMEDEFEIKDFAINSIKIVAVNNYGELQYYVMK